MTHGRDCPDKCSICLGAAPRKVELTMDGYLIDGQPAPKPAPSDRVRYGRRGGKR